MPTPASHTLDELEIALDAATAQMQRLFEENARLRHELAEANARMRTAGRKLRLVAAGLPQTAAATDTSSVVAVQEKAA
jgi:hypothetical protein